MMTRRSILAGLSALPLVARAAAEPPLYAVLDAVGALEAEGFHPARALAAMTALLALGPSEIPRTLQAYLAARRSPPGGLFVVIRCLVEVPPRDWPVSADSVLQPGHLRPPALGAPYPAQPGPPTSFPRFPAVLLSDVPLCVVSGYSLGGLPEPLSMHLERLAGATWRSTPLAPAPAGSLRYLLMHWGQWPRGTLIGDALEAQLQRLEQG